MTRSVAAVLLPVALGVAACGTSGGTVASSGMLTAEEWQEPAAYSFAVTSSCGERSFIGDYRVDVAGGEVVASEWRNPEGQWEPVDQLEWVPTLGDMVDEVHAVAGTPDAGEVTLETDPADGHPTAISVDPLANAIDDEHCYVITDYEPA
jgi:hypothetical protein